MKSKSIDVTTTGLSTVFALEQGFPSRFSTGKWIMGPATDSWFRKTARSRSYKDIGKAKAIAAATEPVRRSISRWSPRRRVEGC